MSKHIIEISADTNDADYIDRRITVNLNDVVLPVNFLLDNVSKEFHEYLETRSITYAELLCFFSNTLCQIPTHHNWYREDYDEMSAAIPTVNLFLKLAFGLDLDQLEDRHDVDLTEVSEFMIEWFYKNLIPFGEFGVHTIDSIKTYPAGEVDVFYERETWANWYNPKTNSVVLNATYAPEGFVRMPANTKQVVEDNGVMYFLAPNGNGEVNVVPVGSFQPLVVDTVDNILENVLYELK